MYAMAVTTKNNSLKWVISAGIVVVIYSLSYFYSMLPGSDSQYFRGLTEYLSQTGNLSPMQPNHGYYQWPCFFILTYLASSVSALSIPNFEFVIYTAIGFLLAISLHFYASRAYKNNGFLMVIVFFISMFYFLNYQAVPFSLALALLFLIFMLETMPKNLSLTITIELLFAGTVLTHAFVPLFFIIYLVFRTLLDRSKYYGQLLLVALSLFFIIQLTIAQSSFATHILVVMKSSSEYSSMIEATNVPVEIPIDNVAQMFSRIVTIATFCVSGIGFIGLLIKKKLRNIDKALFLTGGLYSGLGIFLAALGSRAIILAFMPVGLGAVWLFETKYKKYLHRSLSLVIIVVLVLFLFIPLHMSFNNAVFFQTQEAYKAENFFVQHTDWNSFPFIFAYSSVIPYLQSKVGVDTHFTSYLSEGGQGADAILYTIGLGKDLSNQNYSLGKIIYEEELNLLYNNGFSCVATRTQK